MHPCPATFPTTGCPRCASRPAWTVQSYADGNFGGAVCTLHGRYLLGRHGLQRQDVILQDHRQRWRWRSGSGVDNVSANQARPWYKCVVTCSYVIVHYTVAGGGQQNVNATYNSGLARWEYTITGITSGQVLAVPVHLQRGTQHDTAWASWTKP